MRHALALDVQMFLKPSRAQHLTDDSSILHVSRSFNLNRIKAAEEKRIWQNRSLQQQLEVIRSKL
jgi:hypothetical protein